MEHNKVLAVKTIWFYDYQPGYHFKLFDTVEKAKDYFEQLITEEVGWWSDLGYPVTEEMFKNSGCYKFNEDTACFEHSEDLRDTRLIINRDEQYFVISIVGGSEFAKIEIDEEEIN